MDDRGHASYGDADTSSLADYTRDTMDTTFGDQGEGEGEHGNGQEGELGDDNPEAHDSQYTDASSFLERSSFQEEQPLDSNIIKVPTKEEWKLYREQHEAQCARMFESLDGEASMRKLHSLYRTLFSPKREVVENAHDAAKLRVALRDTIALFALSLHSRKPQRDAAEDEKVRAHVEALEQQLGRSHGAAAEAQAHVRQLQERNLALQQGLTRSEARVIYLDQQMIKTKDQSQPSAAQLAASVKNIKQELLLKDQAHRALMQQVQALQADLAGCEEQLKVQAEITAVQVHAHESKVASLEDEHKLIMQSLRRALLTKESTIEELSQRLERASEASAAGETRQETRQTAFQQTVQECQSLKSECQSLKSECHSLKRALQETDSQLIEALAELEAQRDNKGNVAALRGEIAAAKQGADKWKRQAHAAESKLAEKAAPASPKDIGNDNLTKVKLGRLENEVKKLKAEKQALAAKTLEQGAQVRKLQEELKEKDTVRNLGDRGQSEEPGNSVSIVLMKLEKRLEKLTQENQTLNQQLQLRTDDAVLEREVEERLTAKARQLEALEAKLTEKALRLEQQDQDIAERNANVERKEARNTVTRKR